MFLEKGQKAKDYSIFGLFFLSKTYLKIVYKFCHEIMGLWYFTYSLYFEKKRFVMKLWDFTFIIHILT